jgi:hypothetical protein
MALVVKIVKSTQERQLQLQQKDQPIHIVSKKLSTLSFTDMQKLFFLNFLLFI